MLSAIKNRNDSLLLLFWLNKILNKFNNEHFVQTQFTLIATVSYSNTFSSKSYLIALLNTTLKPAQRNKKLTTPKLS